MSRGRLAIAVNPALSLARSRSFCLIISSTMAFFKPRQATTLSPEIMVFPSIWRFAGFLVRLYYWCFRFMLILCGGSTLFMLCDHVSFGWANRSCSTSSCPGAKPRAQRFWSTQVSAMLLLQPHSTDFNRAWFLGPTPASRKVYTHILYAITIFNMYISIFNIYIYTGAFEFVLDIEFVVLNNYNCLHSYIPILYWL